MYQQRKDVNDIFNVEKQFIEQTGSDTARERLWASGL